MRRPENPDKYNGALRRDGYVGIVIEIVFENIEIIVEIAIEFVIEIVNELVEIEGVLALRDEAIELRICGGDLFGVAAGETKTLDHRH